MNEAERAQMWVNFFNTKPLGTVVLAQDQTVWQKRDRWTWQRVGAKGEYMPESIEWPVDVLLDGLG